MLELCVGTLADVINGKYKETQFPSDLNVIYQISNGLFYVHDKNIIHRDIKPRNILISKNYKIRLSDFGLSKKVHLLSDESKSGTKGTKKWIAPELKEIDINTGKLKHKATFESDIFSAGLVFFVFLTRNQLQGGIHPLIKLALQSQSRQTDYVYDEEIKKENMESKTNSNYL